jgi:hypothetical protein
MGDVLEADFWPASLRVRPGADRRRRAFGAILV